MEPALKTCLCLLLLAANGSNEPAVPAGRVGWLVTHGRVAGDASAIGVPVRIEPGAEASHDVSAPPWLHVPGQRRIASGGALSLLAFILATALAGGALLRRPGITARDDAVRTRPVTCALTGGAVLATAVCLVANGRALGRFELVGVAIACLALAASVLAGFAGVASAAGRAVASGLGRPVAPGWRSLALGALVIAGLCLLPLAGAAIALAAVVLASGAAFVRPSR